MSADTLDGQRGVHESTAHQLTLRVCSRVSHEGDPTHVCTPGHQEAAVGRTLAGGVQSRTAGVSP